MEALTRFPNLRELCIYYAIPSVAENNTYFAVLKRIAHHGNFEHLEHLDFQIIKFPESDEKKEKPEPSELYKELYSKLSPLNQQFLGPKIPDDKMEQLVRSNLPELPNLTSFKTSSNCISGPMVHPQSPYYQRTGFYYLPITEQVAPQVETLCIETTDNAALYDTYEFPNEFSDLPVDTSPPETPGLLQPGGFPRITNLELKTCNLPDKHDLQRLVERFPNLQRLSINLFRNSTHINLHQYLLNSSRYTLPVTKAPVCWWDSTRAYPIFIPLVAAIRGYLSIRELQHLRELELPWPRSDASAGAVASSILQDLFSEWLETGTPNLEKATFRGIRHAKNCILEEIELKLRYCNQGDDWGVEATGTVKGKQYMDKPCGENESETSEGED
ncbi:hypothetical protein TWF281_010390 [Arthrobotrys megalospora]